MNNKELEEYRSSLNEAEQELYDKWVVDGGIVAIGTRAAATCLVLTNGDEVIGFFESNKDKSEKELLLASLDKAMDKLAVIDIDKSLSAMVWF